MKRLLFIAAVTMLAACNRSGVPQTQASAAQTDIKTIDSIDPGPIVLDPPPLLTDEAPPPKPKAMPWETVEPIVFTPEDEKVRAALPFTPAIGMDPVDGSKLSIRANTPVLDYKGRIYYFSSEANKKTFVANPEEYLKGSFSKL